jgi:hypothetical protein
MTTTSAISRVAAVCGLASVLFASSGCALAGAGLGAVLGASVDHRHPGRGALVGATIGAVAGATVDAAAARAHHRGYAGHQGHHTHYDGCGCPGYAATYQAPVYHEPVYRSAPSVYVEVGAPRRYYTPRPYRRYRRAPCPY